LGASDFGIAMLNFIAGRHPLVRSQILRSDSPKPNLIRDAGEGYHFSGTLE
jgi:hypothetical protein